MATRPGINPAFALGSYPREQQAIIERFAKYFYVTRSIDEVRIGNSSYFGFLMRPAEGISIILNVEREVLVLIADYDTFEARTLTAFDKIYEQFEDERIDKTIRLLISKDENIVDKIRHYLQQDPEYPIVVPYTFLQFQSTTDNFILASIRANYLTRDLFGYQSPLRHEYYFFGRDKLLNNVLDLHRSGQNSSLFGLRKSGKTSTIYAIQRRAKASGCKTVLIDCQDPAVHGKRYGELLLFLLNEIRKTTQMKIVTVPLGDRPDAVSEQFQSLLLQTLSNARTDVLLIFDEIENISPKTAASPHWRSGHDTLMFWQILRSCFQRATKQKITFCFVGTNPHLFEITKINDVANPVYLFAPKTFLPPLSQADAQNMCQRLGYFMGLNFEAPVSNYIHSRFGGHPFFVRQLCSRVHQRTPLTRPAEVSLATCRLAEDDSVATVRGYVREILLSLQSFYPEEYEMLGYLAHSQTERFTEVAGAYPEFIEHLLGYGIIVQRGSHYEFLFEAIRDVLVNQELGLPPTDTITRRDDISRRRNRIEEEIRTALFHWSKQLNESEWDSACDQCISKQTERVGRFNPRQLFSRGQSPLYLLDLMRFVIYCGQYSGSDSGSSLRKAFDVVNKLRSDAHAKAVSSEEYSSWNDAMVLLEDTFLPPE